MHSEIASTKHFVQECIVKKMQVYVPIYDTYDNLISKILFDRKVLKAKSFIMIITEIEKSFRSQIYVYVCRARCA